MGKYWIRNRGRTEGPFDEEKIQGLMRRGRFNRHYQVSEDKKSWYPASDFPELLATGRPGRGGASGGDSGPSSPFDDDLDADAPPVRRKPAKSTPVRKSRSPFEDDDDELDDEPRSRAARDDDDDWDDDEDEDWEDDDAEGLIPRLAASIEAQWKPIVVLLLMAIGGLGWYLFGRENWEQDRADLEVLMEVHSSVQMAHAQGKSTNDWERLSEDTETELADMVSRLNDTASARDHVKQELLFIARDDIPRMFKELPQGKLEASDRIVSRFNLLDGMISSKSRQNSETIILTPPPAAVAPPGSAASPEAEAATGDEASESPGNNGEQNSTQQNSASSPEAATNEPSTTIPEN